LLLAKAYAVLLTLLTPKAFQSVLCFTLRFKHPLTL
jgi:hypothetical protein